MSAVGERVRPSTRVKDWINPATSTYTRPSDWLALPSVVSTDQKFVGLHAVYNHESNFVAVNCAGAYTVDWGDGSAAQNVATGVQANHNYVYTDLGAGTLSTRGYRQAIVTITPQAGQNLTTVSLYVKHNQSGLVSGYTTGWLDIRMAGSLITTLTIGGSVTVVTHRMLEQFEFLGTNGITNFTDKFRTCSGLRSLVALYTGSGTNFTSMFNAAASLQQIPLLNTAAGLTFTSMFQGATSLQQVPLLNTAAGLTFDQMFSTASSLQVVPALNTALGTSFTQMFLNCPSLRSAPMAGTARSIDYSSCSLGPAALDAIYTALAAATNLLSDNAASVETSVADWNVAPVNCAVAQAAIAGADGSQVLRLTSTASGAASAAITTRLAVSASTQYTFLASSQGVTTGRAWTVAVAWYDAGGALISTDTSGSLTASTSSFAQNAVTATSPSNAATASVIVSFTATAGAQQAYFDKMGLFPGTVSTWTPGKATITVTSCWGVASDTPSIATLKGWSVVGS